MSKLKKTDFSAILGNDEIKRYFSAHIENNTCSHAYMIEGAKGTGKNTIVTAVLCALACKNECAPCGSCENCLKIKERMCADIFYIAKEEGKASLGVDAVRRLYDTVFLLPNDLDFKAYVFEDTDDMTLQAQNAFLKLLEEPPANVYFFLLSEDRRNYLPTILSRTILLKTERLSAEQIAAYLEQKKQLPSEEARKIAKMSDGALGRALQGAGEDARFSSCAQELARLLFSHGKANGFEFVMYHIKNIKTLQEMQKIYTFLSRLIRDLLVIKKYEKLPLLMLSDDEDAQELSFQVSDIVLMRMYEKIMFFLSQTGVATNVQLTITDIASELWNIRTGKVLTP